MHLGGGAIASLRLFTFLLFFSMLNLWTSNSSAQSLSCPSPAGASGGVPFSTNWSNNLATGQKIIPVVVHLIGNLPCALTKAQVEIAIHHLNADFDSQNLDWDIEFRLAKFAPDGRCTNGISVHCELYQTSDFKTLTRWPNQNYFNIWVVAAVNNDPGFLGAVSVLPTLFAENSTCDGLDRTDRIAGQTPGFDGEDGVVIKLDEFYPNNAGRHTLAHETGHWLNLMHIFQSDPQVNGCSFWTNCHPLSELATNGDLIDDTNPQMEVNTFNPVTCTSSAGQCSGIPTNLDNFMGYAHPCQTSFTQRQREWMFACLMLNRPFIWSAQNLRCTGVISAPGNISGNVIWNLTTMPTGFVQVPQEIHILANSTLTIAPGITVQFCENAKLVVDPGGHLILDGTLTNTCYGRMWAGVEVRGNASSNTQFPSMGVYTQRRLTANAGSIIQNAITGIFVGAAGGGIVKCTGTTFLNNRKAVQFEPFENHIPVPSAPVASNFSNFANCDFTTDAGYLGDNLAFYAPNEVKKFAVFADLRGIRGISFLGCDFVNLRTDLFSHVNLPESDFRNSASNNIRYIYHFGVPETPQTFTLASVFPEITDFEKRCESIYCDPPCRSDEQINQAKQAIITAKTDYNAVYASYLQQPNGTNAAAQKSSMSGQQAIMQDNAFDVLQHIVATEGSLTDYRYWLGYLDAYETDLALAKSYIGTGEYAQASTLLNAMPTKHTLSGSKLDEFNAYRSVLNILQAHLQVGGNKFDLPSAGIDALKNYAENSGFARVRGQAKAMLAMYGILYPPEAATETALRNAEMQSSASAQTYTLMPNPANESVWLGLKADVVKMELTGQVSLYNLQGRLLLQQTISAGDVRVNIPLAGQPNGYYFVKVRLSNGDFSTLPLVITH